VALTAAAQGRPTSAPGKPKLPDGCFKLLFERFRASTEYTDLAPSTQKEYGRHMRHLEPVFGFHPVAAFTADLMDKLIATLQRAIRRRMSVLLGYAMRILRWLPADPLLGVQKIRRRGRKEAGAQVPLREPAIARFRTANPYGSRGRLILELGLTTAFRREYQAKCQPTSRQVWEARHFGMKALARPRRFGGPAGRRNSHRAKLIPGKGTRSSLMD
jgi:hypothetical protein